MLTSIRGLTAATLSAGLFLSAAPAFASDESSETIAPSNELIEAEALLTNAKSEDAAIVLSPEIDRATKPVDTKEANSVGGDGPFSFSANVALTSDYRFRGVTLSDSSFAVQGGLDLSHSSGFYVGTWASSLDETTVGYGSTEVDLYGGWSGDLTDGFSADVGVIGYLYPDAGPGDFDYVEFYGSLSFSLGPVSVTPGIAYAPDQDSLGGTDNLYLYGDISVGIPNTPITLNGHLGYTEGFLTFTNDSTAVDWSISADLALNDTFTISAAVTGVDGDPLIDPGEVFTGDAFVATVSASF